MLTALNYRVDMKYFKKLRYKFLHIKQTRKIIIIIMTIFCLSFNAFLKYNAYIHFIQLSFILYNNLI